MNVIGNYDFENDLEDNILEICVKTKDIIQYWNKCGLISDFGSFYISMNYPDNKNISNSISFVLNELIENAVKYSLGGDNIIKIYLTKKNKQIIMDVINLINKNQFEILRKVFEDLEEPQMANKIYIERLGSLTDSQEDSGIGLLSIINFFKGKFSAKFQEVTNNTVFETDIQVKLDIEDLL